MIVFTCPECGGDLRYSDICTYPPIHVAECPVCGWREEKRENIKRIPYTNSCLAISQPTTNTGQVTQHDQTADEPPLKDESYSKADVIAMFEKLRQEIGIMSDSVVEGSNIIITCWSGMQKRICNLIQSKINSLKEIKDDSSLQC